MLIFCSSRKGCESTAKHISKFLKQFTVNIQNSSDFLDISSAIDALRRCPVGLDPTLEETFPSGVAYHHAGLTVWLLTHIPWFPICCLCRVYFQYFDIS